MTLTQIQEHERTLSTMGTMSAFTSSTWPDCTSPEIRKK